MMFKSQHKAPSNVHPALHRQGFFRAMLVFFLLSPLSAWAYLDPTTGSMLISAIVGLIASVALAVKTYWYRLKSLFKGKPDKPDADDEIA